MFHSRNDIPGIREEICIALLVTVGSLLVRVEA